MTHLKSTILQIKNHAELILGSASGFLVIWQKIGDAIVSIVTAAVITAVSWFVRYYLEKWKDDKAKKSDQEDSGGAG